MDWGCATMRYVIYLLAVAGVICGTFAPGFRTLVYPIHYYSIIAREAPLAQVNPLLVASVARVESHFREDDISHAGAVGLMQVMPATASWISGKLGQPQPSMADLAKPTVNIRLGSWYLHYLLQLFHGNLPEAIAAYNAGPTRVQGWLNRGSWSGDAVSAENIPVLETRHFVERVLYTYQVFNRFY